MSVEENYKNDWRTAENAFKWESEFKLFSYEKGKLGGVSSSLVPSQGKSKY